MKRKSTLMTTFVASIALLGSASAADVEVGKIEIPSDTYNFPGSGILDRTFSSVSYTNTSSTAVTVEVTVSGSRTLITAPPEKPNVTEAAFGRSGVFVLNETLGRVVSTDQDSMPSQIPSISPSSTRTFTELTTFSVSIPAGQQYSFKPYFRAGLPITFQASGSSVTTTGYVMRVVLKQ